jgi:iron complex outermembrane receptor protein
VVIGYGSQKKKDLTGSIASISSTDFVKGNLVSPEQLIAGKVAGVQITSGSGMPGAGSQIRIRGGASLNANNDPLIVIDGVPIDNNGVAGAANALSFVNPNDIETFTILKDASAAAIYGSRASNGVILITTKKGRKGDDLKINFSSLVSYSQKTNKIGVLSADEFRAVVNQKGNADQKKLLGKESTDWQEQIYQGAVSTDNNLSFTGALKSVPFRVSIGYLNQNGILKTSNMNRMSGAIGISPLFFDNHLKVDVNLKVAKINNRFADQGAIATAVSFDPTQAVRGSSDKFGGYFEWLDPATGNPNTLAPRNPLGLLEQRSDMSDITRSIGNVVLDYKLHFLPALRANLNVGYDISKSEGKRAVPATAAAVFNRGGVDGLYTQNKSNKTLEFYLNYAQTIKGLGRVDIMGGYSWQDFLRDGTDLDKNLKGEIFNNTMYKTQNTLVSFYGRANVTVADKYLLTATLRRDGSSRFSPENRWGLFPSAALAWKLKEESFLKSIKGLTDLKLRLGYGVTGQQDVGSDYPYLARYTSSEPNAQYQLGNTFFSTLRPEGYDANIKWEQTETINAALDYAFLDGKIAGSVDVYSRKTKDLLSVIPVPAGSNLTNQILTNVGNIENNGVEFTLNLNPIRKADVNLDLNFNITYNQNKITNLTKVPNPTFPGILVGGIAGGVGNTVQIHTVNYPTNSFFVYQQVYTEAGQPLEGVYADKNGDGKITPDDRYRYQNPTANLFFGFSPALSFKNLSIGAVTRGSIGNYVYNNINSQYGVYRNFTGANTYLSNIVPNAQTTNFNNNQYFSDYYIENASFFRIDNISVGYDFGKMFNNKANLRIGANVQNVFVMTKYKGLDPEVAGGIDYNLYPRPRVYAVNLNLNF